MDVQQILRLDRRNGTGCCIPRGINKKSHVRPGHRVLYRGVGGGSWRAQPECWVPLSTVSGNPGWFGKCWFMKSRYPVASEARAFSFLQLQCSFAGGRGVPSKRPERRAECLFRAQDHVGVQFFQQLSHSTKVSPKQIWTGTIYSRPSVSAWSWFLEPHPLPHTKIHGCSSVLCKMVKWLVQWIQSALRMCRCRTSRNGGQW